jgi:arylsulfatase A
MAKRSIVALLTGMAVFSTATPVANAAPATAPERPNIVLILADDLGYGDVGAYGQTQIETPNIDALARQGVRLTNYYAGNPVCAPSRATLLTGRDSGHGQIRGNMPMGGDFTDAHERGQLPLKAGTATLPAMLKSVGYDTAAIGKWGLGGAGTEGEPTRHGFDHFFGYLDQMQAHNYYPTHLWRDGQRYPLANAFLIPHPKLNHSSDAPGGYRLYMGTDYAPERMLHEAEAYIAREATGKRPFFLYYAPTLPHAAMQVPDTLLHHYDGRFPEHPTKGAGYSPHPIPRAARAAMITRLDQEVGRLRTSLERAGISGKTLIIFCSDNGPSSEGGEDIAFFDAAGGLRGEKRDLFEGGIRSPFIAYWPGHVGGGNAVKTISAAWDILPTLAEIVRAPLTATFDGHSFRKALTGGSLRQTEPLYWEYHGGTQSGQAVRDGRWKAIRFQPLGVDHNQPIQLYDLSRDPHEERDLASKQLKTVARLRQILNSRDLSPVRGFNFDPAPGSGG